MHDLVGIHDRMRTVYRMYLESAFPLRYPAMNRERRRILDASGVLSQPPLIEPMPLYPSSGLSLADASAKLPGYEDLRYLGAGLFEDDVLLHTHQWDSLEQCLVSNKDIVVTTGTGSGKTECFLLPILAEFARESREWPKPDNPPVGRKWWRLKGSNWEPQWSHSRRTHAMRVLILYPLNALVEDQLRRLRSTLDSPQVHAWLDKYRQGNRVLFGRYTSQTPVAGDIGESGRLRDLREHMKDSEETSEQIYKVSDIEPAIRYYFANIDGGEMWSRQDMQCTPPDIMITNYSMLNIMLMRKIENRIFEMTRKWLRESAANHFTIVVDELHSYRGTPGTEVAYTLRLLLERLDIKPSSDKLRIMATTASMQDDESSHKFLREFFGRDDNRFALIPGKQIDPAPNARKNLRTYHDAFTHFAHGLISDGERVITADDVNDESVEKPVLRLTKSLGYTGRNDEDARCALGNAMQQIGAIDAVRDACVAVNGSVRATQVPTLDRQLFADIAPPADSCATDAMRGLLLALALSRNKQGAALQPVRGHLFFRNLQKLWVCCNPKCDDSNLEKPNIEETRPIGVLHTAHCLSCSSCGARVFDLIVCQICGEVFLGGFRSVSGGIQTLTADQPDLQGIPDKNFRETNYSDYGLFWPSVAEPEVKDFTFEGIGYKWEQSRLNIYTAEIQKGWNGGTDELPGWLYVCKKKQQAGYKDERKAFSPKCPNCDADFRWRRLYKTPLRQHRPGFQRVSQVLAGSLVREMPSTVEDKPARKLVMFTDSRQDAAKLAAGMELDHYRDMVRVALLEAHKLFLQRFVGTVRCRATTPAALDLIRKVNPTFADSIPAKPTQRDSSMETELAVHHPDLYGQISGWLNGVNFDDRARKNIEAIIKDYPCFAPLWGLEDIVFDKLMRLGVCPGGPKARALRYNGHDWWRCFNWIDGKEPAKLTAADQTAIDHHSKLNHLLMYEVTESIFPNRLRTFESLGLGYVTYLSVHDPTETIVQCVNAIVRAVTRRHNHYYHPDFIVKAGAFSFPRYCVDYMELIGAEASKVEAELRDSQIAIVGESSKIGVQPDHLWLYIPPRSAPDTPVKGYCCPVCGSFYMHQAGGYCIECLSKLEPGVCDETLDYYRYLAKESGKVFRFRCEELTGQTDLEDRLKRQRWFQEIFLPDESPNAVMGVDLLSVTTTMEAGVDIGSIQGIMLANMPPRRFNYQQRVGRGGRRGAGLALAITVCRDRSHDDYYYLRTEEITGSPPPTPYIDVLREEIIRRMLIKEVMRQAFASLDKNQEEHATHDSVHGEFGAADEWQDNRPGIESYIKSPGKQSKFRRIIEFLTSGTPYERDASFADGLLRFVSDDLLERIDSVTSDGTYTQEALSERLANAGLLPMFGFPTRVRQLFTESPYDGMEWPPPGVVERTLDLAMSAFAPGSQLVKNKEVHTACGVAVFRPAGHKVVIKPGFASDKEGHRFIGKCRNCQAIRYYDESAYALNQEQHSILIQCPACHEEAMDLIRVREPLGFFTDFRPDEFEGTFEWQPRATRPRLELESVKMTPVSDTNVRIFGEKMNMISLNDNGGEGGFKFRNARIGKLHGEGVYAVDDAIRRDKDIPYPRVTVSGEDHFIALLCRRLTDVLVVDFCTWPDGVIADPVAVEGRAAWYSFAFLMRLAAAKILDIDARGEIEAGFRSTPGLGMAAGQAFLSDALENGAGYCRWLSQTNNLVELLAEASVAKKGSLAYKWFTEQVDNGSRHQDVCDTSCHKCIRDYDNMAYHGLLDWRLALDMARIATDANSVVDIHSDWQGIRNPWRLLVEGPNAPVPRTMSQLGFKNVEIFNNLTGLVHLKGKSILIICHPLWTDDNHMWRIARAAAEHKYPGFIVHMMNPFRALRRPTDYLVF